MQIRDVLNYFLSLALLALTSVTILSCGETNHEQSCSVGEENCACFANSTCSQSADGDWLVCGEKGICRQPTCPQGTEGCGCFSTSHCNEGLFCQSDGQKPPSCVRPNCPAGDLNCGCFPDRSCGVDATGAQLVCEGNTCTRPRCQQGSDGCACNPDFSCDDNLLCNNGTCGTPKCVQGSLSCACEPDGSCHKGLSCDASGICQALTCPQGQVGCGCFSDFTCGVEGDSQLLCSAAGRCVRAECPAGSPNCGCAGDGTCTEGYQCRNALCVKRAPSNPNEPPLEPSIDNLCLTSCKDNYTDPDGEFYPCRADGLMEACLPKGNVKRTCVSGSCIVEGEEEPRSCLGDDKLPNESLCPAHQRCDEKGFCASNCRSDNDCFGMRQCHMNVCRMPCDVERLSCGEGEFCSTRDAESGFCMPKVPVKDGAKPVTVTKDRFSVNVNLLQFTNTQTELKVIITNHSNRRISIPLYKWRSRTNDKVLRYEEGEQNQPLDWIKFRARNKLTHKNVIDTTKQPAMIKIPHAGEDLGDAQSTLQENQVELTISLKKELVPKMWDGELKLGNRTYGETIIGANYFEQPNGRWQGTITYFSDFQVKEKELNNWISELRKGNRITPTDGLTDTRNVLLSAWYNFTLDMKPKEDKLNAALSSLYKETWRTQADPECKYSYCFKAPPKTNCDNDYCSFGVQQAELPPSGAMEYPFAINLQQVGKSRVFSGKIVSDIALQYASAPHFSFELSEDLRKCEESPCLTPIKPLEDQAEGYQPLSLSMFGGRYLASKLNGGFDCKSEDHAMVKMPWFIEGLKSTSVYDDKSDQRVRYQCRAKSTPLANHALINQEISTYNPILDGISRTRKLELIDGGILDGDRLIIIFRERFENFVPSGKQALYAYGVIDLEKRAVSLTEDDYASAETTTIADTEQKLSATCSPDLLNELEKLSKPSDSTRKYSLEKFSEYLNKDSENVANAVLTLINGVGNLESTKAFASSNPKSKGSPQGEQLKYVHYLCHDTGRLDGCYDNANGGCPRGSRVTYFILAKNIQTTPKSPDDNGNYDYNPNDPNNKICQLDCNNPNGDRGTCGEFLGINNGLNNNQAGSAMHPGAYWLSSHTSLSPEKPTSDLIIPQSFCYENYDNNSGQQVVCDDNRSDLRQGLNFYLDLPNKQKPNLSDIYSDILEAFRYRSRFQNRSGVGLGFTPAICDPATDNLRYCYSPTQIEKIRERVDCLQWIYNGGDTGQLNKYLNDLNGNKGSLSKAKSQLERFMRANFGVTYVRSANNTTPIRKDGFEKLYAELLIMLGQESYTNALRARFDLAGIRGAAFPGDLFETNGMRLSGTAGFEMYNLYKATQYYDFALEQFYGQLKTIQKMAADDRSYLGNAGRTDELRIITAETVEEYYNKLILASTEKANTWSEIARKYQSFNRSDLARVVLKRGYASIYTESVIFNYLISDMISELNVNDSKLPQLQKNLTFIKRRYEKALREMREIYANLSDEPKVFGQLDPEYIPFPTLDTSEPNAFEKIMLSVRRKLGDAAAKEERALNESRSFETDTALFQQELTRLRNSYENQLGNLCGTFEADNGRIYPAVSRYAYLGAKVGIKNVSDPCGLIGNGTLFQRYMDMETLIKDFSLLKQQHEGALEELRNIQKQADEACALGKKEADIIFEYNERLSSLRQEIRESERFMGDAQNQFAYEQAFFNIMQACSPTISNTGASFNPGACEAASLSTIAQESLESKTNKAKDRIETNTRQLEDLENERIRVSAMHECGRLQLHAKYDIRNSLIKLRSYNLEVAKLVYRKRALEAEIESLRHQAKRIVIEQADAEQMAIDVEAARNDPNVRLYRNDAVQAAQRTFESARLEVYKATKVFEYYSSQSYPPLNDLFLIRMIARGTPTLEAYVDHLEDAFNEFEENYGLPDLRVDVISVRDDLLRVPFTEDNADLSQKERVLKFREAITDNRLLDRNGYRMIPFSLGGRRLSPLTRNHKIDHIEAEFVGARVGDSVGRLYLRNSGTSIVKPLEGFTQYYTFPRHIAVINTFFNGQKVFPPNSYQNQRLRDRPYLNSRWELILNQVDEEANQDIDLNSLTDIKLYVYYRDFTNF